MSHATFIHFWDGRKKKIKSFLDYPLFVQGLTKGTLKTSSPSTSTTPASVVPSKTTHSTISEEKKAVQNPSPVNASVNKVPTMVYNRDSAKSGRRKSIIRIKKPETVEQEQTVVYYGDEVVSEEKIIHFWKEYYDQMKNSLGGFSSSIIGNCDPKLSEDQKTIHLIFRNETNEMEFNKMSLGILEYLKSNLKNNHLSFTTEISKEKAKKMLYTNRDKFNHFAEKHPKLLEWESKLGLELK